MFTLSQTDLQHQVPTDPHRHARKARKSKGHPDRAADILRVVLLVAVLQSHPSINQAIFYTARLIQGRSGLRSLLASGERQTGQVTSV